MSVGYDINVIMINERTTAKIVNTHLIIYTFPINFGAVAGSRDISRTRMVPSPKSVKIPKKARYANTKLYLPKSAVPRYLARYIVTNKDIILNVTLPTMTMPVFFATLCVVLKQITR